MVSSSVHPSERIGVGSLSEIIACSECGSGVCLCELVTETLPQKVAHDLGYLKGEALLCRITHSYKHDGFFTLLRS